MQGTIVGIPAIVADETTQEGVDIRWGQVITVDERLQATFIEFGSPGRCALPSGIDKLSEESCIGEIIW